jgi:hypothetical protein
MIAHVEPVRVPLPEGTAESEIFILFGAGPRSFGLRSHTLPVAKLVAIFFAFAKLLSLPTPLGLSWAYALGWS